MTLNRHIDSKRLPTLGVGHRSESSPCCHRQILIVSKYLLSLYSLLWLTENKAMNICVFILILLSAVVLICEKFYSHSEITPAGTNSGLYNKSWSPFEKKKFHTKRGIRAAHDFRIQRHLQENKGKAHSHLFCKSVSAQHAWGLWSFIETFLYDSVLFYWRRFFFDRSTVRFYRLLIKRLLSFLVENDSRYLQRSLFISSV